MRPMKHPMNRPAHRQIPATVLSLVPVMLLLVWAGIRSMG